MQLVFWKVWFKQNDSDFFQKFYKIFPDLKTKWAVPGISPKENQEVRGEEGGGECFLSLPSRKVDTINQSSLTCRKVN